MQEHILKHGGRHTKREHHTHTHFAPFLWSATPQSSSEHLYIALMSILSVMIYLNRTSHCAEKFISSSLCASSHPAPRLYLLVCVCACHVSWICPVVKYFSEQMDPGGGRQWFRGRSVLCLCRSGRGPTWERSLLASPEAGAPVPAWGQKSQRHLTNCVSSISSEKDHSKFNWEIVQGALKDRQ